MSDIKYHAEITGSYDVSFDLLGIQDAIDNLDRPHKSNTTDPYVGAGTYAEVKSLEAGVYVAAGTGKVHVEEGIYELEAKGPSGSVGAGVSAMGLKAKAFAKAEVASVSGSAGPLKAKVGLALDTGAEISLTGVEVQFLGTGAFLGRRTGFSIFGNEISVRLW